MVRVPFPGEEGQDRADELSDRDDPRQEQEEELLIAAAPVTVEPPDEPEPAGVDDAVEADVRAAPPQMKTYVISAAAGILAAAALLLGGWALWGGQGPDSSSGAGPAGSATESEITAPQPPEPPEPQPEDQTPMAADPTPELKLVGTSTGVLMPGRGGPAALDEVYCMITLGLRAADEAMDVRLGCQDILLETPEATYAPLGLLAGGDWRKAPVKRLRLRVNPNGYETWTVMLAVGRDFEGGTLRVGSLGEVELRTTLAPDAVEPSGRYAETPPRHLKPLLRDPVMRAIQNQAQLEINVSAAGDDSTRQVRLDPVRLAGKAVPVSENTYRLELNGPVGRLECHLRQVDRDTVVLYLAPSPYHQVTFARLLEEVTVTSGRAGGDRP